jgi:hypothetical protein
MRNGQRKFRHSERIAKIDTTPRMGLDRGSTIEKNSRTAPAPSMFAASKS